MARGDQKPAASGAPRIEVDLFCDFGVVPHGAKVVHSFPVRNVGTAPLVISFIGGG